MTRKELERAQILADELVRRSRGENQIVAVELRALLEPPPSLTDIVMSVPGPTHKERAAMIGLSHQGYYNLIQGVSRPNSRTTHRLAALTGVAEDVIRQSL